MNNFLDDIVEKKKEAIKHKKARLPVKELQNIIKKAPVPRDFKAAISKPGRVNIIGELKRASPSKGTIRYEYNVRKLSREFVDSGVDALSVLTEEYYFRGDLFHIINIYDSVSVPILRKDFILDEYQIYESRAYFADAILLISEILSENQLKDYLSLAEKLGMNALVELHGVEQLDKVMKAGAQIVGINNRNLADFSVDINTTFRIKKKIPSEKIIVSESGMKTRQDMLKLKEAGINAVLIGEAFMRADNIKNKFMELSV